MNLTRRGTIMGGLALGIFPKAVLAQTAIAAGPAFGSTWQLVSGQSDLSALTQIITRHIIEVDTAMSPYRGASPLSLFNRAQVGQSIEIPTIMTRVLSAALDTAEASGGAFDPTTGPLVHRYGYGPITGQRGNARDIQWNGRSLHKTAPGLTLDLCGIAKGFALDAAFDDLIAAGATNFMLEMGGELRAHGSHPSGRAWQIAIEEPTGHAFAARHIVAPGALALATSGHRANGLLGDIALSHVIDPQRARPATGFAGSVSVLAATGMEADAWATALLAMGATGPAFARRSGISALFVIGPPSIDASIMTGNFAAHLVA